MITKTKKKNNHQGKLVVPEPKPKCTHCACVLERKDFECCFCHQYSDEDIRRESLEDLVKNLLHRIHSLEHEVEEFKIYREQMSKALKDYQDDLIEI